MGIGVTFSRIACDLETAESERRLRRRRIRRRASDEVVIFARLQDANDGRHLAFHRYHRGNLDNGDAVEVNRSMLAPEDSADWVVLLVVGWEIDGAGNIEALSQDAYDAWIEMPPLFRFGSHQPLIDWVDRWVGDNLIMLSTDQVQYWESENVVTNQDLRTAGYDLDRVIAENTDLVVTKMEPERPRVFGPVHREVIRYQSSKQHSDYTLEFEFRGG